MKKTDDVEYYLSTEVKKGTIQSSLFEAISCRTSTIVPTSGMLASAAFSNAWRSVTQNQERVSTNVFGNQELTSDECAECKRSRSTKTFPNVREVVSRKSRWSGVLWCNFVHLSRLYYSVDCTMRDDTASAVYFTCFTGPFCIVQTSSGVLLEPTFHVCRESTHAHTLHIG